MNWDRAQGNWKQMRGRARELWAKLTGDRDGVIDARREILAGSLQAAYGVGKEHAARQMGERQKTGPQSTAVRR